MALTDKLTAIANAIRAKTGKTAKMTMTEMVTEIEGISGGDTTVEDGLVTRRITEYTNERVTEIGSSAFGSCLYLTTVNFPLVTTVGNDAFNSCRALASVSIPLITTLPVGMFKNCSKLASASFPKITSIGASAFYACQALATADFPLATSIGNSAFYGCTALATADFPLATSIGNYAFAACKALTTADFPLATSIGNYAFNSCSALTALVLRSTSKVCTLSNTNALTYTPIASGTGYIYVPDSLVDSYKAATNWSTYAAQIKPLSEYTGG